jgi:hypothetical protein
MSTHQYCLNCSCFLPKSATWQTRWRRGKQECPQCGHVNTPRDEMQEWIIELDGRVQTIEERLAGTQ